MHYFDYCHGPKKNNETLWKKLEVFIRKFDLIPKLTLLEIEEAQLYFFPLSFLVFL